MKAEPSVTVAAPPEKQVPTGTVGTLFTGKRGYIAALLFFNLFITYTHRMNLSIAAPAISKQYGWDAAKTGILLSSYQWTYCLFLLPWGWLTDRFGTRATDAWSTAVRGTMGVLTAFCGTFGSMLAVRLGLGFGEADAFPAAGKVVREWFPASERGLATSIFNIGTFAGPAFSAVLLPWMLNRFGWRFSFMFTGSWAFAWVIIWLIYFRIPSKCSWLSAEERDYILAQSDSKAKSNRPPKGTLFRLLSRKTMWGLFITQSLCAYTMLLFLFWLFGYLREGRHMSSVKAGLFTAVPYTVASLAGLLIGKLSDSLLTHDDLRHGKRRTLVILFILLSLSVIFTDRVNNEYLLMLLTSLSVASIAAALSLNIAMTSDVLWNANMVGTAISFIILGGNISGAIAPIATGYIVKWTGSFNYAFYLAGFLLVVAAITSFTMTRKPMSFDET